LREKVGMRGISISIFPYVGFLSAIAPALLYYLVLDRKSHKP
jgi:hypothetical protein